MFEWFFGNPEKKELKDFNWLKEQLAKEPASQEELSGLFTEIETVVKDLDKASLKLYLKDEDIIKKCEGLSVEILRHESIKEIKRNLESYEPSLRKYLNNVLEAVEIAKAEKGSAAQIFSKFKELVKSDLKEISNLMKELIKLYDFLEHIHLSSEEIEFYVMKKKREDTYFS